MAKAERYQHYEVLKREDGSLWELGRGTIGITYKAYDTNLRCTVALKVINSVYLDTDTARQHFLREVRAIAALRHQNVASVFHVCNDRDDYFYVTEFIDGETVDAYLKRAGPLEPAEALNIALQVARALAVAAEHQLVHRDLKPTNLMLVNHEGESKVKVIDFVLVKFPKDAGEDSGELTIGGFIGTPHFSSPEQIEDRDIDVRSDIYSLGAALYYMLTGQSPFSGSVGQIMSQHLYKPLPMEPLTSLPRCVGSLLQQMMEKDRNNRPQTPQDLQKAILVCLEEIRASPGRSTHKTGESTSAFETILSSAPGQALATGVVLAQNYQLIEELGETPQGRKFLADDLRNKRRVSLLVLSPAFLSDTMRFAALQQAVDQLRNAPHPMLRKIYSLETAAGCSVLVEEYVVGPSLLDLFRSRSVLSAPEVVRLLNLLAPLVDHARSNRLEYVDLTLHGIHLTRRRLTERKIEFDLLRPLTAWESLEPKVNAIDFSFSPPSTGASDTRAWVGSGTMTHSVPRGSYVHSLTLLGYELLGGLRARVETTGRYTPIAALSEEGNALLRLGLVDEVASAVTLAQQLASFVGTKEPTQRMPYAPPLSADPPNKRKRAMLEECWEATKKHLTFRRSDRVTFSIFSPSIIHPAQQFILEFWAHLPTQTDEVISLARQIKRDRTVGLKTDIGIKSGAELKLLLDVPSLRVEDRTESIVWSGKPVNASFMVEAPRNILLGSHTGRVNVSASGITVAKVCFSITVVPAISPSETTSQKLPATQRQPRSAFASYASLDRKDVFGRVQGMTKVSPDLEVFLDVLKLRSGQNWEMQIRQYIPEKDVFFLFWSTNAAQSKEVDKEWRLALETRGLEYIDPVPLTDPSLAPPPKELESLHFNDLYVAYWNSRKRHWWAFWRP